MLAVTVAGCSAPSGREAVTVTSTVGSPTTQRQIVAAPGPTAEQAGITVVAPEQNDSAATSSATTTSGAPTSPAPAAGATTATGSTAATPSTTPKDKPKDKPKPKPLPPLPVITAVPHGGEKNVHPLATISVNPVHGTRIERIRLINPEGKVVVNVTHVGRKLWNYRPVLGYGRTYTLVVNALNADGSRGAALTRTFTTLKPRALASIRMESAGTVVGVAHPLVFRFSQPIDAGSRRAVEKMITVSSAPRQRGAFRWFSSTELHWRPADFWRAQTRVNVAMNIYGHKVSAGNVYGQADVKATLTIGRSFVAKVDAARHVMNVYHDGILVKSMPASLGTTKYPTYNGTHVVTEKFQTKIMDSRTWGLVGAGAYRTKVKWATRISNSGEFVHGAPWSEFAQGNSNVSHGCINVSDANAQWYYAKVIPGDPVTVVNSTGKQLSIYDGLGDWAVPFSKY